MSAIATLISCGMKSSLRWGCGNMAHLPQSPAMIDFFLFLSSRTSSSYQFRFSSLSLLLVSSSPPKIMLAPARSCIGSDSPLHPVLSDHGLHCGKPEPFTQHSCQLTSLIYLDKV
eukprot:766067-Hanusia_phi.AAC.1